MNGPRQESPSVSPVSATRGTSNDAALEYNSMILLSRLEQIDLRLANTRGQTKTLAIECLVDLVNHIAGFAEQLPTPEAEKITLETLLGRDGRTYTHLEARHIRNNRIVTEIMSELRCNLPGDSIAFRELSNDLLRIVNSYLESFVKAFCSPRMSEQWRALYTSFFRGVVRSMREIQSKEESSRW